MAWTLTGFADEISRDLGEQIELLGQLGVKHVELRSAWGTKVLDLTDEQLQQAKSMLDAAGIGVSSVGSDLGKIQITDPFEAHLERARHGVEVAKFLGAPYIRMFSFFVPHGEDPGFYRGEVMRRWTAFIEAAEGHNVTLLHENEKDIYGDTAERCLDILQTMDCPFLKATFDPANFVQCGVKTFPEAYQLLREHVVYMHIKDALYENGKVVPAGEGEGRVADILRALKDTGWSGFLSLEPHLADSLPGGGPELFAVAAGALNGLLDRIGRD